MANKGPFNPDNPLVDLDEPTFEPFFEGPHLPPLSTTQVPSAAEQIDNIQDGGGRRYLARWNNRPKSDDA